MNDCRVGKAILIAPLMVYPVMVVPMLFSEHTRGFGPIIGLFAIVVSYAGTFFVGVPIICLLHHYRATRWWQVTLAGAIGAACIASTIGLALILLASVFGAVVAGTFWYIAYRLPSDRTPSNGSPSVGKTYED